MKIDWACYINGETVEEVYYEQLDDTLYQSQYVDHLFCTTENCEAEIKFTERKDGVKFFSTKNGQGTKHLLDCPYYLNYDGEVPRKKLIGVPVDGSVSDDWILNTLLSKSRSLKNKNKPPKVRKKPGSSKRVINTGEENVPVPVDGGVTGTDNIVDNIRFGTINSNFVTKDFLGQRRRIVGTAIEAEYIDNGSDDEFGVIRLQNDNIHINAYFPPAFYADPRVTTKTALETYINLIKQEIVKGKQITIICLGLLEEDRRGNGININIINFKHIIANEDKYYKIITSGKVSDNPYPD
ncbi:hypothetical protein [Cohnella herbarum]|uniref:Uncharacterized protein n=1 Tax=Cohnella herbarum TaxID=2728023 RepID=A0A7Z2VMX4_9BACL|nr:hypothetical protein [Cohnella herbarum]QJD85981.1 hypothetical protein HH215_24265 [Cohnella herbarum]